MLTDEKHLAIVLHIISHMQQTINGFELSAKRSFERPIDIFVLKTYRLHETFLTQRVFKTPLIVSIFFKQNSSSESSVVQKAYLLSSNVTLERFKTEHHLCKKTLVSLIYQTHQR